MTKGTSMRGAATIASSFRNLLSFMSLGWLSPTIYGAPTYPLHYLKHRYDIKGFGASDTKVQVTNFTFNSWQMTYSLAAYPDDKWRQLMCQVKAPGCDEENTKIITKDNVPTLVCNIGRETFSPNAGREEVIIPSVEGQSTLTVDFFDQKKASFCPSHVSFRGGLITIVFVHPHLFHTRGNYEKCQTLPSDRSHSIHKEVLVDTVVYTFVKKSTRAAVRDLFIVPGITSVIPVIVLAALFYRVKKRLFPLPVNSIPTSMPPPAWPWTRWWLWAEFGAFLAMAVGCLYASTQFVELLTSMCHAALSFL